MHRSVKRVYNFTMAFLFVILMAGLVQATDCWLYDNDQTNCEANDCQWMNDPWGSWCKEKDCWDQWSETDCDGSDNPVADSFINRTCNWWSGTNQWCQEADCWLFSGTNASYCESGNPYGLTCQWEESCMSTKPGLDCWDHATENSCTAVDGCVWGDCHMQGCWAASTSAECDTLTGPSGNSCSWDSSGNYCYEQGCWDYSTEGDCNSNGCVWENDYCSDVWCDDWSYTNQTTCENNAAGLSCEWMPGMNRCDMKGCWNYNDQSSCNAVTGGTDCVWREEENSWCEQVECWSFDNITVTGRGWPSTNESYCTGNSAGLSCIYDPNGGWCYKNVSMDMSCSGITTERDCLDTFHCWWDFGASTCNDPDWGGAGVSDGGFFDAWNPGCYIFDYNQTVCEQVGGCSWSGGQCVGHENLGLNCTLINDSTLCNSIPALSTCCNWQGSECVSNWADQSCWDQMDEPPEGAMFCEDYNSYENQQLCEQISGAPWFMPCVWSNTTAHCEFNAADVFGGQDAGFEKIDNKMNCESAGGKWVTLSYCEGNRSVSVGTCEHKFDEDTNCDRSCYACDKKSDGSSHATKGDAKSACEGSRSGLPPNSPEGLTGWCEFSPYAAQDSEGIWGECQQKDDARATGGQKCSSDDCGACGFLGKVSDGSSKNVCETAGCKWFENPLDQSDGWCGGKNEDSCSESCEKCYDSTSCRDVGSGGNGACSWDDSTLVCMPSSGSGNMEVCWDGVDNDGNGNMDCGDSKCFSDPFCGGGAMMTDFGVDCFAFDDDPSGCTAAGCYFVNETWGSWCDMPGMQCFKKDGSNETFCEDDGDTNTTCEWHSDGGGHCGFMPDNLGCFQQTNATSCNATQDCEWRIDNWCNDVGGWCSGEPQYNCWEYDFNGESTCNAVSGCSWQQDPWCATQGENAGFCDFVGFTCMDYQTNETCNAQSHCNWHEDQFSPQGGWCDMACFNPQLDEAGCTNINITDNVACEWMGGFCDPQGFGGNMGGSTGGAGGFECFKFDGDEASCNNQSGCGFFSEMNPFCDMDFSNNCPQYSYSESECNAQSKCKFNPEMNFCDEKPFECHWNSTLRDNSALCDAHDLCMWQDNEWHTGCEPVCFGDSAQTAGNCAAAGGGGACSWKTGWCDPEMGAQMFQHMEKGAPMMLGNDDCGPANGIADVVDICGFGLKDMGDAWGFGIGVQDISNAALCNGVYMMQGSGSGTDATNFYWYLDTDGTATGGCAAKDDATVVGMEFYFKYEASYDETTGSASEAFTAYKCVNGEWGAADIKLSSKKQFMCQEINGGMIAVDKDDLNKYPALFVPGNDFRVYVASADANGTVASPTDTADAGYGTPGAIDFKMECCWDPGADCDGDGSTSQNDPDCEDINKKGYLEYEECLNGIDDDNNGLTDCFDPSCRCEDANCEDLPKCAGVGVNAIGYIDNTAPTLKAVMLEEYTDSALVLYYTDEPANGTLMFYNTSSSCDGAPTTLLDKGLQYTDVRDYKIWHDADIYDGNLGYSLSADTAYYYKLSVCDQDGNCGTSACMNFTTAPSGECHFCEFVTKLNAPTGWTVSYDLDRDGTSDHVQGQVCGDRAGMKTNYSVGRSVDVVFTKSDNSTEMKFLNARLTRSGLSWKTRDFESDGITAGSSGDVGYTGLPVATRDKIVNNLHPQVCQVRIPGTSDELWHCDDDLDDCFEIEDAVTNYLNESGADYRTWDVPYCEFSVWAGGDVGGSTPSSGTTGGGGGGGGGGATAADSNVDLSAEGSSAQSLTKGQKVNLMNNGVAYPYRVMSITSQVVKLKDLTTLEEIFLFIGAPKTLDVDNDGWDDVTLTLGAVNGETATVAFTPHGGSGSHIREMPPPAPRTPKAEPEPAAATAQAPPAAEPAPAQDSGSAIGNLITGEAVKAGAKGAIGGSMMFLMLLVVMFAIAGVLFAFKQGHKKGMSAKEDEPPKPEEK